MSVANELSRIIVAKEAIKTAIESKGGSVGDSIDTYASAIDNLQIGGGETPNIPEIADTDPLTFVCIGEYDDEGSWLSLDKIGNVQAKTFEYNKNDSGWQSYTENTHIPVVVGDKVQFRSNTMTQLSSSTSIYRQFVTHAIFKCGGNIRSLSNNTDLSNKNYSYYKLFENTYITTAPVLQATQTIIGTYCYQYMFSGCRLLKTAPALPATTLKLHCYEYMFSNCTSLVNAPALPATTLLQYCYSHMFDGCNSLVNAPELPATTLEQNCYYYMFSNCTSLVNAPELPATTLAQNCYQYMFSNCTSLVNAPALPATTLVNGCYYYMFSNCTSLVVAPELPSTQTIKPYITTSTGGIYNYMFYGCTSLVVAPKLYIEDIGRYDYYSMFQNCTSLRDIYCMVKIVNNTTATTQIGSGWLAGTTNSSECTFHKNPEWSGPTQRGNNTVPSNWKIVDWVDA